MGHDVKTVRQMGWESSNNGTLLGLAESAFDAFVTADANLAFQQELRGRKLIVIVLRPRGNRLLDLRTLVPQLLTALNEATAGAVVEVT